MRICENGIYRDMTPEEIAELEKLAAEAPAPEPTAEEEERIAALEKDNAELRDALDALLTGVTS
nr:MAG TPA: API3 pepsin inhibitor-3 [Caudoviricetes sp.]